MEHAGHALEQGVAPWPRQTHEKLASVRAGRIASHVGEIQILGNEESLSGLRGIPHIKIFAPSQMLRANRVDVVIEGAENRDESIGKILVEFDLDVIGLRPDVFEVNADIGVCGDGDEGETGRVREVESEPVAEFRAEGRLAERVVNKPDLTRSSLEIAP